VNIRLGLPKGTFGRSVMLLAGGTALGQLVVVAASPILTRLYEPIDLGALAVYVALLTIIMSVASLRFELAIPIAPDDRTAAHLLALCGLVLLLVCAGCALAVWALEDSVAGWTNTPHLEPYLWLLPVGLLAVGINQALSYWVVRRQAYARIARTRVTQSIAQVGTQIGIGAVHEGTAGLIVGAVVGRAGGSGSYLALAWKYDRDEFKAVRWTGIRAAAARYRRFPAFSSGSAILSSVGAQLPTLLLGTFYGATVLGWFALTQRIIALPLAVIGNAVTQAYLGEASAHLHGNRTRVRDLYFGTTKRLAAIGVIPLTILVIGGPWLFTHIFGSAWAEAGTYIRVLAPMYYIQFIVVPLHQTLAIFERLQLQFFYDFTRLALGAGALVIAHALGFSAVEALVVYSVALSCAYALNFWLNSRTVVEATR
jgi:O-antigen/teichoic acid export membrane protein